MTSRLRPIEHALLGLALSLCMGCAGAQGREAIFRAAPRQASPASAVATVVEPAGGQFVYSSELPASRPFIRFAIGKTPPTDFVIFSAEEQHELETLRSRAVEEQTPTEPRLTHEHARAGNLARANVSRRHDQMIWRILVMHRTGEINAAELVKKQDSVRCWQFIVRVVDAIAAPDLDNRLGCLPVPMLNRHSV